MKKTIATMIDEISICNCKIFHLENTKRNETATDKEISEATKKTNVLNVQRSALIDAIDLELNEIAKGKQQKLFGSNKMYGK